MFDQTAELEENRRLDNLLHILSSQNQNNDESEEEESDYSDDSSNCSDLKIDIKDEETSLSTSFAVTPIKTQSASNLSEFATLTNLLNHISFEEFDIITECKDKQLQELMLLNRAKHVKIQALIDKYTEMLANCESNLKYHLQNIQKQDENIKGFLRINKCGYPYFTHDGWRPANNGDFFKKKANNGVNFCYELKRMNWTSFLIKKLKTCVLFNYYSNLMSSESDIAAITSSLLDIKNNHMNVDPPDLYDDTFINWVHIAEDQFKDITLKSCLRAIWNNYVHPKINCSPFTKEETTQLLNYIQENPVFNWLDIAKVLKTNRGEHQLCQQFQLLTNADNLNPHNEDELFFREMDLSVNNPATRWTPSWNRFPTSGSVKQTIRLLQRENYLRKMQNCKLGSFSMQEDIKILSLVRKYGADFEKISEFFPNRHKTQIQNRYVNSLLREDLCFGPFTLEEDQAIMKHVRQNGERKWALLSKQLPRNSAQLRLRYTRLKIFLEQNPEKSIKSLERKTGTNFRAKQLAKLRRATSNFNGDAENMPIRTWRMHTDIDDKLVQYFSPTAQLKKTRCVRTVHEDRLIKCVDTVKMLLKIFNAKLNIPVHLDGVTELDKFDIEILTVLRDKQTETNDTQSELAETIEVKFPTDQSTNILLPPNVSNTQALRYLLLQSFSNNNSAVNLPNALQITDQSQRFKERFKIFFKLPSLLSIVEPPDDLKVIRQSEAGVAVKSLPPKRQYPGRPKKDLTKILRMVEAKRAKAAGKPIPESEVKEKPVVPNKKLQVKPKQFSFDGKKLVALNSGVSKTIVSARRVANTSKQTNLGKTNDKVTKTMESAVKTIETNENLTNKKIDVTSQPKTSEQTLTKKKVLMKVDIATIKRLKGQNLLKVVTPINVSKENVSILECTLQNSTSTSPPKVCKVTNSPKPITYSRKRRVSDKQGSPPVKRTKTAVTVEVNHPNKKE